MASRTAVLVCSALSKSRTSAGWGLHTEDCCGAVAWSNGRRYVGNWNDGQRHGQGTRACHAATTDALTALNESHTNTGWCVHTEEVVVQTHGQTAISTPVIGKRAQRLGPAHVSTVDFVSRYYVIALIAVRSVNHA